MKKYLASIFLIVLVLGSILVYNIIKIQKQNEKNFEESGYILQSKEAKAQSIDRYYFSANQSYKENYNSKVEFLDTDGEKVVTSNTNFIHYVNGSISSLKNGVLLDVTQINNDPISYYNIPKNKIVKKSNDTYTITNLGKELNFKYVLWKISDNKYLIAGNQIVVNLNENDKKEINGYAEIEYEDNEIVNIYNQEITYQTISSKAYLEIPNGIKINLSNKVISQNGENKMSLNNMVIDSEDNVTITDLEELQKKENTISENSTNENNTSLGTGSVTQGPTTVINNQTSTSITAGNVGDSKTDSEETVDETKTVIAPTYKVTKFETTSTGIKATIAVNDEESLLTSDSKIKVIDGETGKLVYENTESLGVYSIDVDISTLSPNTEYTLEVESSYTVDSISYTKNFVYKVFKTLPIGLGITKDVYTSDSLGINVVFESESDVKEVEVALLNNKGETIKTQKVYNKGKTENTSNVEFTQLESNTEYTVELLNAIYNGQVISNGFDITKNCKTLKEKPQISNPEFEIDKRNGKFNLDLKNSIDKDSGIQEYRFEVYDTRQSAAKTPIMSLSTNGTQTSLKVDNDKIFRNVAYIFKVIAIFNDNEKIHEYESEFSDIMQLDGTEFPTISFEKKEVTYERIEGTIIVEDKGNAISLKNGNKFTVIYNDSVGGKNESFTSEGSLKIPVSVNNLRANETYKFSVYTTVDLQDGNDPIKECFIGSVIVKTELPKNLVANFKTNKQNTKSTFDVTFQLAKENQSQTDLESQTLTGVTFSIYPGQTTDGKLPTGTPKRTVKIVDSDVSAYSSEIKTNYYDQSKSINPTFFGSQNNDFKDKYYTLVVSKAYDYTDYQNALPIINNVYTIETNGYMPDLPGDVNDALQVNVIRNRDSSSIREELDASTIVGYTVKASYDNSDYYAKKIIYKAYNAISKALISTKEVSMDKTLEIPSVTFDVKDGIDSASTDDENLTRGNTYYFTYEAELDLNGDGEAETHYPYNSNGQAVTLKSKDVIPEKQEAKIEMFPIISTKNTYSFGIKIIDIDKSINTNTASAKIDDKLVDTEVLDKTSNQYGQITFKNLSKGNLEIYITQKTINTEDSKKIYLIYQYFEGIKSISDIKFKKSLESNKLLITLIDSGEQINNIIAVKVTLESTDGTVKIEKDMLKPTNNIISINLNDISDLLNKETKVSVKAYYDSGITGYNLEQNHFVTYQKPYLSGETVYYYKIDGKKQFVDTPDILGNIYISTRTENSLQIVNAMTTSLTTTITLDITKNGFTYNGNVILPKQVNEQEIVSEDGDNIIKFDVIITGITLKDNKGNLTISSELDNVSFEASLLTKESVKDDLIYIEIYQTDENGKTQYLTNTISKLTSDFNSKITIDGLKPKTYYFLKFRANFDTSDGVSSKYLYDIDYEVEGKQYYFSTLANVGITNISVKYNPVDYDNKTIDITYNLDKIMGYKKIAYKIEKYNEVTKLYEETGIKISNDVLFKNEMTKKIVCNPTGADTKIIFGKKYKIIIAPLTEYTYNGTTTTLDLGTKEYEFELQELSNPIIALKGSRSGESSAYFKVTIYDNDKIIVGGNYSVQIFENGSIDITPEEYVNQKYSINTFNKTFSISNVNKTSKYKILIKCKIDKKNNGNEITDFEKSYELPSVNEYGISVGNVSTATNLNGGIYKIDLIFNSSYKLNEIDMVKYSIYNVSGYSQSNEENFIPTEINSEDGGLYYKFTLNNNMNDCDQGTYYIELQFYKDGNLVDETTVEHVYLKE